VFAFFDVVFTAHVGLVKVGCQRDQQTDLPQFLHDQINSQIRELVNKSWWGNWGL